MRQIIKLPRILKLNWIKRFEISVVFNNGESRVIDFQAIFKSLDIASNPSLKNLLEAEEFSKVKIENNTLSWDNVNQFITSKSGTKIQVPFEIGADVLLKHSKPDLSETPTEIGSLVRDSRLKSGLTQQQLAVKSGTSRNYISRIENNKSGIELSTLRKIVETGLGKKLEIKVV